MSRFVRSLCLLLSVPAVLFGQAPPQTVSAVVKETEQNSQVMAHLDQLTNDIGPRLTGSERLTKACEWARDKFKSFGIENARLEPWGEIEVGFDRGVHAGFLRVGDEQLKLTFGTNAWTPGTGGLKEGKAILAPEGEEGLALLKETAKGSWVVRPPNCAVAKEVNDLCTEVGAHGVIANGNDLILTSGNYRTKADELPKLVRINLHKPAYVDLVARLKAGDEVTLGFDVQNHFRKGPVVVYNVLADIPGTEKPDEIVIVGGHIDSWDGATGTTDNGTGVATTLEAARLLMAAGAKPRRTIRFMLWSGEEQGLLGSYAWIRKNPDALPKISAVLVHDGGTNYVSGIQSTADMLPAMKKAFGPVIELLGQKIDEAVDTRPSQRGGFGESRRSGESRRVADESMKFMIAQVGSLPKGIGSDHDSFLGAGVPGFFWRQAGRANYNHTHHTQHDIFDAAIPEYQKHSAKVIALGALGVANLDAMLPRSPDMASSGGRGAGPRGRRLRVQISDDLTIEGFSEGSRAERAGMKTGDRIIKIDDAAVKNADEMSGALNAGSGKKVITFLRGQQEQRVTVDFDEAPASRPESRAAR